MILERRQSYMERQCVILSDELSLCNISGFVPSLYMFAVPSCSKQLYSVVPSWGSKYHGIETWYHHEIITISSVQFSSVQFSCSVVSDSLRPHELQHARPPWTSPTPRVHSNSRPSSQWCHPAISSSVVPFFSCPQSLPASESFPMSELFTWDGQSTGVSTLTSFLPKKSQGWSPSE